jgi:putative transcriptional regulator
MSQKAFDLIAAGLRDAIAMAKGEPGRGRVRRVRVPDVNVHELRHKLGLSQADFAAAFGVSPGTIRGWEQGRRRPKGPARVLLVVIDRAPKATMMALGLAPRRAA